MPKSRYTFIECSLILTQGFLGTLQDWKGCYMANEYCPKCHGDFTYEVKENSGQLRCQECGHLFDKKEQKSFGHFIANQGFCNTSAAIYLIGIPVRDLWRLSKKMGIEPGHQEHRAVWTSNEVLKMRNSVDQKQNRDIVFISGQTACTSATITEVIGRSRQAVNEWARHHPSATVQVSGQRMILVETYLEHLNSQQQILNAERLRSSTQL